MVVGCAHGVALGMGKLAQTTQRIVDSVFAHGSVSMSCTWKQVASVACQRMQLSHDREGLARKGHDVASFHLHPLGGDTAVTALEIYLTPFRRNGVHQAHEYQRC